MSVHLYTCDPWTIVEVEGEMDVQVAPLVPDLLGSNAAHVVFELHGVTFLDAGGLRVLMDRQRKALHAGGCVRLVAPSRQARRLLRLTRTDRVFPTFESLDAAVSAPVLHDS